MRLKNKQSTWIILIFLAILAILRFLPINKGNNSAETSNQQVISPNTELQFTKHAKCRMSCRDITESEIREVLSEGKINYNKSDKNDQPCPTYAIEDVVKDGQKLRIVFGKCDNVVKVITCIDLGQEHDCDCE